MTKKCKKIRLWSYNTVVISSNVKFSEKSFRAREDFLCEKPDFHKTVSYTLQFL